MGRLSSSVSDNCSLGAVALFGGAKPLPSHSPVGMKACGSRGKKYPDFSFLLPPVFCWCLLLANLDCNQGSGEHDDEEDLQHQLMGHS